MSNDTSMDRIIDTVRGFDGVLVLAPQPGDGTPEIAWGDAFFYYAPDGLTRRPMQRARETGATVLVTVPERILWRRGGTVPMPFRPSSAAPMPARAVTLDLERSDCRDGQRVAPDTLAQITAVSSGSAWIKARRSAPAGSLAHAHTRLLRSGNPEHQSRHHPHPRDGGLDPQRSTPLPHRRFRDR